MPKASLLLFGGPVFRRAIFFALPLTCKLDALRDVFVYIDFSGIFDRKPVGRVLEHQRIAEYMFRPQGIKLNFGKEDHVYIAFERSASMSRENRLAFVRADVYEPLWERMMLGMNIGDCQLSKLYAYNALLFTSGARYNNTTILSDKKIIVIENPKYTTENVNIITVEDNGTDNPIRKYSRVEKTTDITINSRFLFENLSLTFENKRQKQAIKVAIT